MPRHRKPQPLRQNRETRDVGVLVATHEPPPTPPPPASLSPRLVEAWQAYWRSPLARLVSAETDLLALRRLFELYQVRERLLRAFIANPEVPGSMGQMRVNPAMAAIDETAILALEDRFGLNPRARLTLGVILGEAARSLSDLNADLDPDDDEPPPDIFDVVDGRAGGVPTSAVRVTPEIPG
jgi:hypothetical protein